MTKLNHVVSALTVFYLPDNNILKCWLFIISMTGDILISSYIECVCRIRCDMFN